MTGAGDIVEMQDVTVLLGGQRRWLRKAAASPAFGRLARKILELKGGTGLLLSEFDV